MNELQWKPFDSVTFVDMLKKIGFFEKYRASRILETQMRKENVSRRRERVISLTFMDASIDMSCCYSQNISETESFIVSRYKRTEDSVSSSEFKQIRKCSVVSCCAFQITNCKLRSNNQCVKTYN